MAEAVDIWTPQPGYYRTKLVKGGAWVAVRVWLVDGDRDPETHDLMSDQQLFCEIDGESADPFNLGGNMDRHLFWEDIPEQEYRFMVADAAHARAFRPDDPKATPRKPIDLNALSPILP